MTVKQLVAYITSFGSAVGVIFAGYLWISNTIVTKTEFQVAVVDIRIHQVNESLARYHDKGVSTLSDSDRHSYNLLVKASEILAEKRDAFLVD